MLTLMSVPGSVSFVKTTLLRAAELEQKDPIIAYFCKLYAVQQVLATKLHQSDEQVKQFATDLLGEIETAKESEALSKPEALEIISNDEVGKAYATNFASSIFERAAKAVDERRATKATAQTFLAAVNFFDLQQIWEEPDEAVKQQIKYAKFQAARILRALKEGRDPTQEEPQNQVEDQVEAKLEDGPQDEDSEPADSELQLPETPAENPISLPSTPATPPDVSLPAIPDAQPNDLGLPRTPGATPSVPFDYDAPPKKPDQTDFTQPQQAARSQAPAAPSAHPSKPAKHKAINMKSVMAEAATTTSAQKHAKYAISALNYDDIDTAVAELTKALEILRHFKAQ
ncbi:Vacuolar protein sorting-associated protein VTA1 [Wickerhamiella sorbophila]|uniref:Vacuolar protein sorting-associated protein VTA1 n=1 Tax=Wickerhamiella sorbophila TaxID=45607 RepID=A0A2T0FD64_9ASCO|nr:Vacuolar protein sorting-associated protein VTA1 [Wickerhamiella sorbophila]PRT52879.1 Vacuolar protein sorting-associated protein VTA1 [Wickerhamiella sorbophila]